VTIATPVAQPLRAVAPPRTVAVRINGLSKRFAVRRGWRQMVRRPLGAVSHVRALVDVSCEIAAGECFGLLGPNGAGKTTLFKILATVVSPDAGTATVHDRDIVFDAADVRDIVGCAMTSERSLYWRLSARENLRLYASLHHIPRAEVRTRINDVLDAVDLADTGDRMIATFSTGMKQRLLIARALLPRPRVLLLDEPTRSLDPVSARDFRTFLRTEIIERHGCTVLLATHSSEEAVELCNHVGILDRGRLLAVGTTSEIARRFDDQQAFQLWTRSAHHPAFVMLEAEGRVRLLAARPADADGWGCVTLTIPGGMENAADVLACLASSGVDVARFEQSNVSLAELIERAVAARDGLDE